MYSDAELFQCLIKELSTSTPGAISYDNQQKRFYLTFTHDGPIADEAHKEHVYKLWDAIVKRADEVPPRHLADYPPKGR